MFSRIALYRPEFSTWLEERFYSRIKSILKTCRIRGADSAIILAPTPEITGKSGFIVEWFQTAVYIRETGIVYATLDIGREKNLIMSQLIEATTVTFLDPDPAGSVHEYDSIHCTLGPPQTETVLIEVPDDAHQVSEPEHGLQHSGPITPGWEAIVSNSAGEILVDGYVTRIQTSRFANIYTIRG